MSQEIDTERNIQLLNKLKKALLSTKEKSIYTYCEIYTGKYIIRENENIIFNPYIEKQKWTHLSENLLETDLKQFNEIQYNYNNYY